MQYIATRIRFRCFNQSNSFCFRISISEINYKNTQPLRVLCGWLQGDTVRVLYAYHPDDPVSEDRLVYHGGSRRGFKSVRLLESRAKIPDLPDDVQHFDFLNGINGKNNMVCIQKQNIITWQISMVHFKYKSLQHGKNNIFKNKIPYRGKTAWYVIKGKTSQRGKNNMVRTQKQKLHGKSTSKNIITWLNNMVCIKVHENYITWQKSWFLFKCNNRETVV